MGESGAGCDDDVVKYFEHRAEARRLSWMFAVSNVELAAAAGTGETEAVVKKSRRKEASASEEARGGL